MKNRFEIPRLDFWRPRQGLARRPISQAEQERMLDLCSIPTILVDLVEQQILLANAQATELTSYTRRELCHLSPYALLPELAWPSAAGFNESEYKERLTILISRSGAPLAVLASLHPLDAALSRTLVTLVPAQAQQQRAAEAERRRRFLENLDHLARGAMAETDGDPLLRILQTGLDLSGAGLLCVYLIDGASPVFRRAAMIGPLEALPEQLNPAEVSAALAPSLWTPGKRPSTVLQRSARAARLAYLASVPVGQPEALSGLLVAADQSAAPSAELLPVLRIISDAVTGYVFFQSMVDNLVELQGAYQRDLSFSRTITESVQEGIIQTEPDLRIRSLNPTAEQALGYASREVAGQPVTDILIGADNLAPALDAAQQGITTPNLGNLHLHRRDGRTFLAHVRILPLLVEGRLESLVILLRDLSEHEQFQIRNQQLEQRALLGEVTAIFAHEVRNPIHSISTGLQLVAYNLPPEDPNRAIITELDQDCVRLSQLMHSVLQFSRSGESTRLEKVDLNALTKHLLERWRPRLINANVNHVFLPCTSEVCILGDPRGLEQVFDNLVSNALQAMSGTGGNLVVNLRRLEAENPGERAQVVVSVSDTGPGIPEENLAHIFEPFYTTNSNGTGLGLAIAKRLVTAHKGTISVNSVPGGTVFQVRLPALNPAERPAKEAA
jgi:two-component system sensor histidine kinase AtoS